MLKQKIPSVYLESLWIHLHLGMFVSGYGFNVCITPTYHIERIKWLTVHSLNCYRVSVDFLTSHILEKVANCTTLHLLPFLIYMVTKVGCSLLNSTRHLQSSECSFQSFVGVPLLYVTSMVCWLLRKWFKENLTNGLKGLFQHGLVPHFPRFPQDNLCFSV